MSREQLEELRDLILEAIATKNSGTLPPTAGFFFGSAKVDENYWYALESTASNIVKVLQEFTPENWQFEYHSSW